MSPTHSLPLHPPAPVLTGTAARAGGAAETVASVLLRRWADREAAEAAVRVLAAIAASDCIEEENKKRVAVALAADASSTIVACPYAVVNYKLKQYFSFTPNQSVNNP